MSGRNLPAPFIDLDEEELPEEVRNEVARLVGLGYNPAHLMVGSDLRVYVHPELAMLHANDSEARSPVSRGARHPQKINTNFANVYPYMR